MAKQTTIQKPAFYSGISLHQGIKTNLTFRPAPANFGIQFVRIDLDHRPSVEACLNNIHSLNRGTTLSKNGVLVHTIEHIMAAFIGLGVDNVVVEMDGNEPPLGDGSSDPFVKMIQDSGIIELNEERKIIILDEPVWIHEGDSSIVALPYDGFKISFTLSYKNTQIGDQYAEFEINQQNFLNEISVCRTFCFYDEVEQLMDLGLIKGGSLDNAVVATKDAILSKECLRYNDEFVRHKILDLMGDLYLLGSPLKAHLIAIKSGHAVNVKMAKAIEEHLKLKIGGSHV